MPPEIPLTPESREQGRKKPALRDSLKKEALAHTELLAEEDSHAYEQVSLAIGAFLGRTLNAAEMVEGELQKNEQLRAGDERRLQPNEIRQYEDFLTQAEALAIILPRLLQQARVIQYSPEMQKQLQEVYELILNREELIEAMELARATILRGSLRRSAPLHPSEIAELVPIATVAWMLREKLSFRAELTSEQKRALLDLLRAQPDAEEAYKRKTEEAGIAFGETGREADAKRREAGAERVTQGLPGAEFILDAPELSIAVWERFLTEAGPKEKVRHARQFREGVAKFQKDFLELQAYEEFKKEAEREMAKDVRKNEFARKILQFFWFLGGDAMDERVLTDPKEFQNVFEKVLSKTREKFEEIRRTKEAAECPELLSLLEKMEKGEQVNEDRLRELLESYALLQRQTGALLSALQRWQIAENVDRVGGKGDANMLDQVTRVDDKTFGASLRNLAPYGVFRSRSYRDEKGRLILLAPAPDTSSFKTQLGEGVKSYITLEAAILTPILHRMMMRVPLLGRVFRPWYVRLGVPVAFAEISRAGAKGGAELLTMKNAIDSVEQSVLALEAGEGSMPAEDVRKIGNSLFEHLLIAMQAAEGDHPGVPRQDLALEAHIYTNQLLTALGYPPYHEISRTVLPSAVREDMSPEVREYVAVKVNERGGITAEARAAREKLRAKINTSEHGQSAPTNVPTSEVDQLLQDGKLPRIFSKEKMIKILLEAANAPEFRKRGGKMERTLRTLGDTAEKESEAIFALAGDVHYTLTTLRQLDADARKVRGEGTIRDKMPKAEREKVEQEVMHLVHEVPLMQVLTASRFLVSHEPSNEVIAKVWARTSPPSGWIANLFGTPKKFDDEINMRFGNPGNRTGLGTKFLEEWVELQQYDLAFLSQPKK